MKVVIFGTGQYYQRYKDCFRNVEVIGLLDNNIKKQGRLLDGHVVYAPEQIGNLLFDQIWLLSFDTDDMRKQLLSLGVLERYIYEIWELGKGLDGLLSVPRGMYYSAVSEIGREPLVSDAEGKVVFLTPNLWLNGAEIALMQMVQAILHLGYKPLVASLYDGDLRENLLALDVPVILMGEAAHEIPLTKFPYLAGADAYIFNTIEMYLVMQDRYDNISTAWWLHDSGMVYQESNIIDGALSKLDLTGVDIHVVSPIAGEAFRYHYGKDVIMKELPFGLDDWSLKCKVKPIFCNEHKFTFAVVGNLSLRKSQNDFLNAVKLLPKEIYQVCRFCIVGAERNLEFVKGLRNLAEGMSNVQFMGEMGREELLNFYAEEMDVLVCPSRSDTLPIVTVEAMMFGHPVIASEAVGTTPMLLAAGAGLSVPVGDTMALADAMQWFYDHPQECALMGESARRLYEETFTVDCFQSKVKVFMQELMDKY